MLLLVTVINKKLRPDRFHFDQLKSRERQSYNRQIWQKINKERVLPNLTKQIKDKRKNKKQREKVKPHGKEIIKEINKRKNKGIKTLKTKKKFKD